MKISFKLKLILFLELFVIAVNLIMGFFIWKQLSGMVRDISRNKLMAIAASSATLIDGELHEALQTEEDESSEKYKTIQSIFKKIKDANEAVDDIYTLRKTDEDQLWTFVVSAKDTADANGNGVVEEDEERVAIGEEFDASECPELPKAITAPSADYDINCDKWGCWLSGYAPVKDENNATVAVVGVDVAADDIVAFEKSAKIIILLIIGGLTILLPLILYPFLGLLLKPITVIAEGLSQFGHNFSSRINIRSNDEFELIASTFNSMAGELQTLYQGLEKKIKDKTQQLDNKINELEQEKAKDEALLKGIGEGMLATDKKGKIILMNTQAQHILGYHIKSIQGTFFQDILLRDTNGHLLVGKKLPTEIALSTGKKISDVFQYTQESGRKIFLMITASPVIQKDSIIGCIVILRDITEEKEIDKAKSEFVSLASHQLRTPLSSLNWYIEMLLDHKTENLDETQKKYLVSMAEVSGKMVELINALLNVSRIEMGTFSIDPQPVKIEEIAKSVLEELKPQIAMKNLRLVEQIAENLPVFKGDVNLLRIILQNLLTNAIKYTPEGGSIELAIYSEKKKLLIKVTDTGYGIPNQAQNKIFSKLFRADNVKEMEFEGTGLGLYIVKSIIDNSGGKITFKSKENQGTTFLIAFPLSGMKKRKGTKALQQ